MSVSPPWASYRHIRWAEIGSAATVSSSFATGLSSAQPAHIDYAAESGGELSYRDATGTNTMTEIRQQ